MKKILQMVCINQIFDTRSNATSTIILKINLYTCSAFLIILWWEMFTNISGKYTLNSIKHVLSCRKISI